MQWEALVRVVCTQHDEAEQIHVVHHIKKVERTQVRYSNELIPGILEDGIETLQDSFGAGVIGEESAFDVCVEALTCESMDCVVALSNTFRPCTVVVVGGVHDAVDDHASNTVGKELGKCGAEYRVV